MSDALTAGAAILLAGLGGGLLYRIRGAGPGSLPRWLDLVLWAAPLGVMAFHAATSGPAGGVGLPLLASAAIGGLVALAAGLTGAMGHGSYMDLGRNATPDNESLAPVLDRLGLPDPSRGRDLAGLGINGLLLALPLGLAYGLLLGPLPGLVALAGGLLKPAAYELAAAVLPYRRSTEGGEALTGFFLYAAAAGALLLGV